MSTNVKARHRKAARPLTPLTDAAPVARRGLAVAASSGLALTMIASGANAASDDADAADSAGALSQAGVAALATDAREVVTTNAAISTGSETSWSEDVVEAATVTATAPVVEEPEVEETVEAEEAADAEETSVEATQVASTTSSGEGMVALAMQYIGTPYVWGASGPSSFDCSGLVSYIYAQYGISIPHQSGQIRAIGTPISADEAQPGDILWWSGHVGLYAGNGMMVDATPSKGVAYRAVYSGVTYLRVS
ncbi:C40 family peptidase [Actinomyces ruminis]|uniref:NlpC/P60 family protein n=1 Tax=Actinomyces ruminis TaxID=1937003 RepID=A0ABX4MDQ2_9ACTO|nr:C40 family peptidase [Actinomyces ruminis]PHP53600.1 NlpC/P60 family protein [Actinomyces ruminis]